MPAGVTVVAAEFEDLVKVGLRQLISAEDALELVASDVPLSDLSDAIEEHSPDVALLNFGSLPSPATVHELHERYPDTRIVVLANRPTAAECNQMLSFGATACISKETQGRDIINAIHLASRGMYVMPRSASSGLVESNGVSRPGPDLLTSREAGVLELLQEGRTNAEIAHELSIGIETVRTHARNIYRKLGISSRRDLASLSRTKLHA
ncbi:MAG TPA: response regulator transcription factor [Thermoleophilaceae bacterium]|nr:response regulator transcription factor [Thermoleophilaceae bacterium]